VRHSPTADTARQLVAAAKGSRRAHTIAFTDRHDQRHAHRRPKLASDLALANVHGPDKETQHPVLGTAASPQAAAHGAQPARHLRSAATMHDGRGSLALPTAGVHTPRHVPARSRASEPSGTERAGSANRASAATSGSPATKPSDRPLPRHTRARSGTAPHGGFLRRTLNAGRRKLRPAR